MLELWKLKALDGLEMVRSTAIQLDAPQHFHAGYALGIATAGLQTLLLQRGDFLIHPQSFLLLNPEEIHAHQQHVHAPWSHRMLYISPEYVNWLQQTGRIRSQGELRFTDPLPRHLSLYQRFFHLHQQLSSGNDRGSIPPLLADNLADLFNAYASPRPIPVASIWQEQILEIQHYLNQHLQDKLQLDELSRRFKANKFQLIRYFKREKGVTPNEYLTIIRVEAAKRHLAEGNSLLDSALEVGFYDQSHFSHSFLKYTCVTPGQFQRNCLG